MTAKQAKMTDELFEITGIDHEDFEKSLMAYMAKDPFVQKEMQHFMTSMQAVQKECEDKQKKTDNRSALKGLDFKKIHTAKKLGEILDELDMELTCNHLRIMCLIEKIKSEGTWDPRMLKQLEQQRN